MSGFILQHAGTRRDQSSVAACSICDGIRGLPRESSSSGHPAPEVQGLSYGPKETGLVIVAMALAVSVISTVTHPPVQRQADFNRVDGAAGADVAVEQDCRDGDCWGNSSGS